MSEFEVGDRVRIVGHSEFADGIVGTIAHPETFHIELAKVGEWHGPRRICNFPRGRVVFYYVVFDGPSDDGSGDGPYLGAEIEADCLESFSDEKGDSQR